MPSVIKERAPSQRDSLRTQRPNITVTNDESARRVDPMRAVPPPAKDEPFGALDADAQNASRESREIFSFVDLLKREINWDNVLLGKRWLCKGGAALFVAPSGVGKSTMIQQAIAGWACGRDAFGIVPNGALPSLVVQAENDNDDLTEIARGVYSGLKPSDHELQLIHANTHFVRVMAAGTAFLIELESLLAEFQPKLLIIDPFNAYVGGDAKDPALIADFCRNGLNKLLFKYDCGLILIHHTPKTNYRDTSNYSLLDFSYAGAGGADLTNWARAVISIEPLSFEDGIFRLIAAKRGKRIGWIDEEGSPAFERVVRHSREPGIIRWEDASRDEVDAIRRKDGKGNPVTEPSDALLYIANEEQIGKTDLIHKVQRGLNIGERKATGLVRILLERGELHEHRIKRHRKRDALLISRHPQNDDSTYQVGGKNDLDSVSCSQLPITHDDNT